LLCAFLHIYAVFGAFPIYHGRSLMPQAGAVLQSLEPCSM